MAVPGVPIQVEPNSALHAIAVMTLVRTCRSADDLAEIIGYIAETDPAINTRALIALAQLACKTFSPDVTEKTALQIVRMAEPPFNRNVVL